MQIRNIIENLEFNGTTDMHMHSIFSDGTDNLDTLLNNCISSGLKTFSLTDHDIATGSIMLEDLIKERKAKGSIPDDISFVRGIEFSCKGDGFRCHILGYDYSRDDSNFEALIEEGNKLRRDNLEQRLIHLKDVHGIEFDESELEWLHSITCAGKPHLAKLIVRRGLAIDISDAINRYLKGFKQPSAKLPTSKVITGINAAGGTSVYAHPLGGEGEKHIDRSDFEARLKLLISYGIQGIECHYSRYSHEEIAYLTGIAKANRLIITGGSDYHGSVKNIKLGTLHA